MDRMAWLPGLATLLDYRRSWLANDLVAGLVGGLGFAPSANIGNNISIFEAVHGTAPDIAGRGIANPTSLILSGLMLLRHVCLVKEAAAIENALLVTLESGVRTGDFGDKSKAAVGTREFVGAGDNFADLQGHPLLGNRCSRIDVGRQVGGKNHLLDDMGKTSRAARHGCDHIAGGVREGFILLPLQHLQ